ncbi:putative two-component response regulator ARR13 [Lycium barbarum]|uniref:putative two-component response regulator ARR13 n=1 Tax=Lycium barbarum TaxID=112863 RepID=UPI00293E8F74|nr:putative two-component response regulator ARR13 [Lycium barbarum]
MASWSTGLQSPRAKPGLVPAPTHPWTRSHIEPLAQGILISLGFWFLFVMFEEEYPQTNTEKIDNPMAAPCYESIKEVRVMLVNHHKEFVNEMADLLKSYNYKEENSQTNTKRIDNPMVAPYNEIIKEVRVIFVDHDKEFVNEIIDLLKSYSYKDLIYLTVDTALEAMSILSKGKQKIDLVIINVDSPDLLSFPLLDQVVGLDIVSLFVCDEYNAVTASKALNKGAYLYLEKPLHKETVKYLWQFVFNKKMKRGKVRQGLEENRDRMNVDDPDDMRINNIIEKKNVPINIEEQCNNIHEAENNVVSNEKYKLRRKRGRKSKKEVNEVESQSNVNKVVRQKVCTIWTADRHAKFMKDVHQLGDGRCYPIEILEVMNVPGITRLQVASHLQKCRSNNWRVPKERRSIHHPSGQGSSRGSQQRCSRRKYGTIPHLQTNVPNLQQQHSNNETQREPDIFARGESSTQQQVYHSQLQVQPHYLSIDNPFTHPFLSTQNNVVSGVQQQHEPLFEMLDSQGLQDPISGSTSSMSGLAFNSEDYHTQNDYNLDLDAAHVTTYSGSTIMSCTNNGNATSNEFGVTNATFQQHIGEPNMSDPNNIIAESHVTYTKGSDSNEKENYDSYFDFNNIDCFFQNLGPSSTNLPNEHGSEFDHIYSDDQVSASI